MAQNEVGEITLSGGGTSSAMAHKQNPVAAETLVARLPDSMQRWYPACMPRWCMRMNGPAPPGRWNGCCCRKWRLQPVRRFPLPTGWSPVLKAWGPHTGRRPAMNQRWVVVFCGLLMSLSAFSTDITLPAFPDMVREFATPYSYVQWTVTVYSVRDRRRPTDLGFCFRPVRAQAVPLCGARVFSCLVCCSRPSLHRPSNF